MVPRSGNARARPASGRHQVKILLSWSSGKDSAWALHLLNQQHPGAVSALLTTVNEAMDRVAMHGVRREVLEAQARADEDLAEQARVAAQRSDARSAFAELSAAAALVELSEPEAAPDPEPEPAPARSYEPVYAGQAADTDMASLFRELSSLGMEDEPAPVTPARPPARPAAPAGAQSKKKKGLFGR